jgi:peptide/nickel transport system permease protein
VHASNPAMLAGEEQIQGRSLSRVAWGRLRRDKVALASGAFIVILITGAIFAPRS